MLYVWNTSGGSQNRALGDESGYRQGFTVSQGLFGVVTIKWQQLQTGQQPGYGYGYGNGQPTAYEVERTTPDGTLIVLPNAADIVANQSSYSISDATGAPGEVDTYNVLYSWNTSGGSQNRALGGESGYRQGFAVSQGLSGGVTITWQQLQTAQQLGYGYGYGAGGLPTGYEVKRTTQSGTPVVLPNAVDIVANQSSYSIFDASAVPGQLYTYNLVYFWNTGGGIATRDLGGQSITAAVLSPLMVSFTKIQVPAVAVGAAQFRGKLVLNISNPGSFLNGPIAVNVFANTGKNLDGNQILAATTLTRKVRLYSGRSFGLRVNIKLSTTALKPGTYHLIALVVDPTGLTDFGTSEQTIAVLAPLVSLRPVIGTVKPNLTTAHRAVLLSVTIGNQGNINAPGKLKIVLAPSLDGLTSLPGMTLRTIQVNVNLRPGETRRYFLRFKRSSSLAVGLYYPYITFSLDGVSATAVGSAQFTAG